MEDLVVDPEGKPARYATIRLKAGVAVLPVDDDGNVYVTRQYRYAIDEYALEAVAGAIDHGEGPLEAARRELKEELGIEALEFTELGIIRSLTSISNAASHLYLATHLTFGREGSEPTEDIEIVRMPLAELAERARDGRIVHAETCILAHRAASLK